jgi:hypothetical protein
MLTPIAFAVAQVNVAVCPFSIACGLAESEAVGEAGGGGGGTVEATCALWHALRITTALKVRSVLPVSGLAAFNSSLCS